MKRLAKRIGALLLCGAMTMMLLSAAATMPASAATGEAATPYSPWHKHAATAAPDVANKVDLLSLMGKTADYTVSQYQVYGELNDASKYLATGIDLAATPYLYYSISQPDSAHINFGLHTSNPWYFHRDAKTYPDSPGMSTDTTVATDNDIYGCETGCLDLRELVDSSHQSSFNIMRLSFYRGSADTVLNYFFIGSAPKAEAVADGPAISLNIDQQQYVGASTTITASASVTKYAVGSLKVRLEGQQIGSSNPFSFTPASQHLSAGTYTMVAEATDTQGNTTYRSVTFRLVDRLDPDYTVSGGNVVSSGASITAYGVTPLSVTPGFGATTDGTLPVGGSTAFDELSAYKMKYEIGGGVTTKSDAGIPYQTFDVALGGKTSGTVALSYSGKTLDGERMALKAYNVKTKSWDTLSTFVGSGKASAQVDVATYNDGGVIHAAAMLDYVTNGSDKMIWVTDPQHYTKFDDLNEYYYRVYEYIRDRYQSGDAAYAFNTGDLVDNMPTNIIPAQWVVSSNALKIIDDAGMPNGVVSGNHDVGNYKYPDYNGRTNTSSDYTYFWQNYPASRYNTTAYYGGSFNNNTCHYDLITVGNIDFVVIFLGYGMEATDETIEWVNSVLKTYRHRSAILATHAYITSHIADYNKQTRAQLIYDTMIDPNPNVCMLFCGHDDGAQCIERTTSDGRKVYEILSDYQFVQAEDLSFYNGEEHYIGAVPNCCGDGYLREMTFTGGRMHSTTYSPITGRYNPYGTREELDLKLAYVNTSGRLFTTYHFSAGVLGSKITSGTGSISVDYAGDWMALVTKNGGTSVTNIVYITKGNR